MRRLHAGALTDTLTAHSPSPALRRTTPSQSPGMRSLEALTAPLTRVLTPDPKGWGEDSGVEVRAARRRRDDDATRRDDDATRRRGRGDGAGVCSPHALTVAAGPRCTVAASPRCPSQSLQRQRWLHDAVLSESLQPPGQSPQVPSQSCHPCSPQVPLTVAAAPQPHRPHCSSSPDQKGWVRIEPLGDDEAQRRRCGDDEATTYAATTNAPEWCHRNVATEITEMSLPSRAEAGHDDAATTRRRLSPHCLRFQT